MKQLTIAIPTRNRSRYLEETLNSLLFEEKFADIEIIICDNSSNDETLLLMRKYIKYKNIQYIRNPLSLSIDENMIKVASLVQTKYFLWLGDDDFIVHKGLKKIIKYVSNNKYDFILLSGLIVSENLKKKIGSTIQINKNIEYTNANDFFREHCFHMPFGTLVVKKEHYDSVIISNKRYFGTSHAYSGLILDYLAKIHSMSINPKILVVGEELIKLRNIEKTWKGSETKIMFEEIPLWFNLLDIYYNKSKKEVLNNYIKKQFRFKNLLKHRLFSQLSMKHFMVYTKGVSFSQKVKYLIVSMVPLILIKKK